MRFTKQVEGLLQALLVLTLLGVFIWFGVLEPVIRKTSDEAARDAKIHQEVMVNHVLPGAAGVYANWKWRVADVKQFPDGQEAVIEAPDGTRFLIPPVPNGNQYPNYTTFMMTVSPGDLIGFRPITEDLTTEDRSNPFSYLVPYRIMGKSAK